MNEQKTIVVLYYTRGVYPLRDAIKTHLYCWKKYSKHQVIYINVAFGVPWNYLRYIKIDVIILHTLFLGMRWSADIFYHYTKLCEPLKNIKAIKIAIPQDEFVHTDMLIDFLHEFGITHVFTCASKTEWIKIYNKLNFEKIIFRNVLTGYIDENSLKWIKKQKQKRNIRDIVIGYRAWKAQYWLGEHGQHKVRVAEKFSLECERRRIKADISLRDEDTFLGNAWFEFLLRCQFVVGVEGGASILDKKGKILKKTNEFLAIHPDATFEDTRNYCFPNEDNQFELMCLSPRHFEAAATETCQLLVEGNYNGIFKPDVHYIPIKRDYSNIEEAFQKMEDKAIVHQLTKAAYEDIVQSGKWTYQYFVQDIEQNYIDTIQGKIKEKRQLFIIFYFKLRDYIQWRFIQLESICNKNSVSSKIFYSVLNMFLRLKRKIYKRTRKR